MEETCTNIPLLLGTNVKRLRNAKGLTQSELAEKLGITQKHLSIIETGKQFASAELIAKLANELQVTPAELFGGTNPNTRLANEVCTRLANQINPRLAVITQSLKELTDEVKRNNNRNDPPFLGYLSD